MAKRNWFSRKGQDNKDVTIDPWGNSPDTGPNNQQQQQQSPPNPQPPQPVDKKAIVMNALKERGLGEGLDLKALMTAFRDNDEEAFVQHMVALQQNTAMAAVSLADTLIHSNLKTASSRTVDEVTKSTKRNLALAEMHKAFPFTKEKAVAPVAEQVLDAYLQKGLEVPEVMEQMGEYYREFAGASAEHFGFELVDPKAGNPNSRRYSDPNAGNQNYNNENNNQSDDEEDWTGVLTHGAQTFDSMVNALGGGGGNAGGGEGAA